MKTLNINRIAIIAILSCITLVGCKKGSEKDHGHAHGPNGEHVDDKGWTDPKQEEFNVGEKKEVEAEEQSNTATIVVKAKSALEYKFRMDQYSKLEYTWKADAKLHYDFHGDPAEVQNYPQGYFESYAMGSSNQVKGKVTIPYNGAHGWYWANASDKDITITLTTKGKYDIIGLKH